MPSNKFGQLITFAVEIDADDTYSAYIRLTTSRGDTPQRIAARHGHPEEAQAIAKLNGVRSIAHRFKVGTHVRIPGHLKQGASFNVLPQNAVRPTVTDGYALYQVQNRIGTEGINQFAGYNPVQLTVPIHFLIAPGYDSADIERDIALLERMAGRGNFKGSPAGAPAVVRVSVTDLAGNVVPLIPASFQWTKQNPSAPLYRVGQIGGGAGGGISWDNSARSDKHGRRIDATCTVYLTKFTPISVAERSATRRSKTRNTVSKP